MTDIAALTGELHAEKQRRIAAEMHAEVVTRQLEELQAELEETRRQRDEIRSAHDKDTRRLMRDRDTWKAEAMRMIADRTVA